MENLIKQMRVRYFDAGRENIEESSSSRGRRIPPQKSQSFKGEKKRTQNWFQRQFSGQMNRNYDLYNEEEKAVAVAATAYTITLKEESSKRVQKKIGEGSESSLTKTKSRKEDTTISITKPTIESKPSSGKGSTKSAETVDSKVPITIATDEKAPDKATISAPPIRKTPTFADKDSTSSIKPKTPSKPDLPSSKPASAAPKADQPPLMKVGDQGPQTSIKPRSPAKTDLPSIKPGTPAPKPDQIGKEGTQTPRQGSTKPGPGETKADAWEKAEMAKIKERYEKLKDTIISWENKNKSKATKKLRRTEGELERRRSKALQKYNSKMEYIKQIVGGARAQAEERQRNEELKAKEKANIIRTTGEIPKTCLCLPL